MPEKNYSKREQDHFFGDLFKRMDKQDDTLGRIEEQTTSINGRVNKLEWWQKAVIWAVGAVWVLILVIIPVLAVIARHEIQRITSDTIDSKWTSLVDEYDKVIINNR